MILDDFANLWFKTCWGFLSIQAWILVGEQFLVVGGWGMRVGGWGWLSFWGSISLVEMVNMNYILKLWTIDP